MDVWAAGMGQMAKKTIFVIEMQLKFVNVVVAIARAVQTWLRTLTPCIRIHLAEAPATPTSPPWQIFNELHFLRVLGPSCKGKSLFSIMAQSRVGRLCWNAKGTGPLALGFICCQKIVPWLIMRGQMFKLKTSPADWANIIKSLFTQRHSDGGGRATDT